MRLIMIEPAYEPHPIYINPNNVSWVGDTGSNIIIKMNDGKTITTKFTTAENAIDYIQRATTTTLTQE